MNLNSTHFTNATHCLCYNSELASAAYNLSSSSLQCLADHATPQSAESHRTIWNIIWSSLMTIFACTWVSCHPNISFNPEKLREEEEEETISGWVPNDEHETPKMSWKRWWKKCRPNFSWVPTAKIAIIFVALFAPECIVIWAFRQYISAKETVKGSKGQYHLYLYDTFLPNEADKALHHSDLTMTSAFFSLMGGFVITDQERNPVQVLVLHPSHMNQSYFTDLLPTITKVDDHIKARLKILLTDSLEASVTADSVGIKRRGFADADAVVDEIVPILITVIIKTLLEYELLQVILSDEAVVQSLAMNMATEAVEITFPIITECKDEMSNDLTRETFGNKLRDRLEDRLKKSLSERLRGIRKTLEMDIRGRRRQDSLAKTFALAQTTWFVAQCIARRAQHLRLTEIELMACAYATLNTAIYFFWWHKPFRVDCPLMLRSNIPPDVLKVDTTTSNFEQSFLSLLGGNVYSGRDFHGRLQVPPFYPGCLYSDNGLQELWNILAEVLTAAVFGGIHLFAWNYQFPTQVELRLWRISALIIVGIPLLFWIFAGVIVNQRPIPQLIGQIYMFTVPLLYIIARIAIIVLSFISLRKLPVGTLSNVDWLTFIPHID